MRINTSALRFSSEPIENGNCVLTVAKAKTIAQQWITSNLSGITLEFGLPEVDDRYEAWHVPLLSSTSSKFVGTLRISCKNGDILLATDPALIKERLNSNGKKLESFKQTQDKIPNGMDILCGDSRLILREYQSEIIDFAITSPPYFNAKPEYTEYATYEEYLDLLKDVFLQCHRLLKEGRFMVINASPVLLRRTKRSNSSKRIPVPFHINTIMESIGFDFMDDIIWTKPSGAGWNTGRGRRFAADRNPLQYKPVPITEYFLVYRKHTDKLIDWNIRQHPDQDVVKASKIPNGYEVTNVWHSPPAYHKIHPAIFPNTIIRKFIRYYSFKHEIVLDPFAGIGTVGQAAIAEERQFFLVDINEDYYNFIKTELIRGDV